MLEWMRRWHLGSVRSQGVDRNGDDVSPGIVPSEGGYHCDLGHPVILVRRPICMPVCEQAEGNEKRPCHVCSLGMRIIDSCPFFFFFGFQVLTSPTFSFKGEPDPGN